MEDERTICEECGKDLGAYYFEIVDAVCGDCIDMGASGTSKELMHIELFGGPEDGDCTVIPIDTFMLEARHIGSGSDVIYDRRKPFYQWDQYATKEGIAIPFDYRK